MYLNISPTTSLTSLFPEEAIFPPACLENSLNEDGLLLPLLVIGGRVVDGQKRFRLLKGMGAPEIPTIKGMGCPWICYWKANEHRSWNPVEIALVFQSIDSESRGEFLRTVSLSPSPHLAAALEFVALHPELWSDLHSGKLPLSALRDLAHLGIQMPLFAKALIALKGTVAEKRLIANLLRQAAGKGPLPEDLVSDEFSVFKQSLEKISQPRRMMAQERFEAAMKTIHLPPGTSIETDPTFERPGLRLQTNIKRKDIQKLKIVQEEVEKLFSLIPEL